MGRKTKYDPFPVGSVYPINAMDILGDIQNGYVDPDGRVWLMSGTTQDVSLYPNGLLDLNPTGKTVLVSSQSTSPYCFHFKPDGTKFYMGGTSYIYSYTLSTPWDVTTASYDSQSLVVTSSTGSSLHISDDGVNLYSGGTSNIVHYTLSTPWDVTTGTLSYNLVNTNHNNYGLYIRPDGTTLYSSQTLSGAYGIQQWSLSTPFDLSTATKTSLYLIQDTSNIYPRGICLTSSGTIMYIASSTNAAIHKLVLGTPFEISTATETGIRYSTGISSLNNETSVSDFHYQESNNKSFIIGWSSDRLQELGLVVGMSKNIIDTTTGLPLFVRIK